MKKLSLNFVLFSLSLLGFTQGGFAGPFHELVREGNIFKLSNYVEHHGLTYVQFIEPDENGKTALEIAGAGEGQDMLSLLLDIKQELLQVPRVQTQFMFEEETIHPAYFSVLHPEDQD